MGILEFIISLLSSGEGLKFITALIEILTGKSDSSCANDDHEFDPEIEAMFEEISGKKKTSPKIIEEGYALEPISNVANKEIIYNLNRYFSTV